MCKRITPVFLSAVAALSALTIGAGLSSEASEQTRETAPSEMKSISTHHPDQAQGGQARSGGPPRGAIRSDRKSEHGKSLAPGSLDRGRPAQRGPGPSSQKTVPIVQPRSPGPQNFASPSSAKPLSAAKEASRKQEPQRNQPSLSPAVRLAGPRPSGLHGEAPTLSSVGGPSSLKNNAVLNGTGIKHKP